MSGPSFRIVILGLSITSSWGNGHATNYRGLVRALADDGHEVLFLERDVPWYAENCDLPNPPWGYVALYSSLEELKDCFAVAVRDADLVLVGSYVPQGVEVGHWVTATARGVTAFYDIDTPVTLSKLAQGHHEYLSPELVSQYDLYLSFTGGPTLDRLAQEYGARRPRAFYCCVDPSIHYPEPQQQAWDLGYLGTYSSDRQPALERLLLAPARAWPEGRFMVVGPMYPETVQWPRNVVHTSHLPPSEHRNFYNSQRFTLNITRADMMRVGWSPSVRLFEAAACATPVISDYWPGLETFFTLGREILVARSGRECLEYLRYLSEEERAAIGQRARERALASHTAAHRAAELVGYIHAIFEQRRIVKNSR
jgi:spore maturation protein CgeB